ncbi:MAG: DUF1223 domain-containing protein [Rhodobacteraceae bacterium]|nr:DUF1223 domain-containing protein [Paracoccaceae bacterium]
MRFVTLLTSALLTLASHAVAEDEPVVVELYTSQGCSSCPPADALMHGLSMRDDVIGLALHVDYWDYIGWKDEFADPAYTNRQRLYARARGTRTVYTPQMVVHGNDFVVGFKPDDLAAAIRSNKAKPYTVDVDASRRGNTITVEVEPKSAPVGEASVYVVTYAPHRQVDIRRGENAGRTLDYYNIVTSWTRIGVWDGAGRESFAARMPNDEDAVVLVQPTDYGPMLAAARAN